MQTGKPLLPGFWLFLFCAILGIKYGISQSGQPHLSFSFIRQNDFTWVTNTDFDFKMTKKKYSMDANFHHDNIYNSSPSQDKFVQLYVMSSVWQRRKLSKKLDAVLWTETDQYLSTQNQKFNIYGGFRLNPTKGFYITPLGGYSWDLRSNILNQGFSPALFASFNRRFDSEVDYKSTAMFRYKFIAPRRQLNFFWDQKVQKEFGEKAEIVAHARLGSNELNDFIPGMVKRIISDTISPGIGLKYFFPLNMSWGSQNNLSIIRRRFLYEALPGEVPGSNNLSFSGLELNLLQTFEITGKKFLASFSYEFQFYTRNYTLENNVGLSEIDFENEVEREKEKDYLRNANRTDAVIHWNFSGRSTLIWKFGNQYIRYDSPSELNNDDRDELTYASGLECKTNWTKSFYSIFTISGNYRHYAFLLGERSQDNYIQRSLRSDFLFRFTPFPSLTLNGENAVYVTYNVKDFRDYGKTDRSTRNLETNLKAEWKVSSKWVTRTTFNRKETQQSYLNWEKFTETTLDTNQIVNLEHTWSYKLPNRNTRFEGVIEFGYRHYAQTRRQIGIMNAKDLTTKNIVLHTVNLQTGPQVGFKLKGKNGAGLNLVLWLQNQLRYYRFKETDNLPLSSQSFLETELEKFIFDVELYPNASIQLLF